MDARKYKIVYCTPALYMAGGVERVLTLKANYFAEHFGYDITIILTEGKDKPLFYPLSDKIKVINLDVNFEEMWTCSFFKKIIVYLKKQRIYRKRLTEKLMRLRPDITISLLRREINFINDIKDGSKKIGEMHINREHYRSFEGNNINFLKQIFSNLWMKNLIVKLKRLERLVVLTEKDKESWVEIHKVLVIPNPLPFQISGSSSLNEKRVIAVGRYSHEKGFDFLLSAWKIVSERYCDWHLDVFGDGDRTPYETLIDDSKIDRNTCILHGKTNDIQNEYLKSTIYVCSSRFEGFGLTIVEAMACGLPVVSFDCPWGPRSIISDSHDGFLVENGNIEMLANCICELISNEELRNTMSRMSLINVRRFQLDEIAGKWKSLFDEVMA